MSKKYILQPDYAVHPGETLREKLKELNMNPKEFAIRTGKPLKTISNVLNGKSSITPEMAVKFEKVLGIPANFWMKKQANYNEYVARDNQKKEVEKSKDWVKKFPYSKLVCLGYIEPAKKLEEKAEKLLSFFNVSNYEAWENIYLNQKVPLFFRISLKHTKDPYALSALLRIGEKEASKIEAKTYDKKKLKDILPGLKSVMCSESNDFLIKIQEYCASAGVKVVYTPNLPKTVINGVVRWINDNPVVQMTDRFKRYDIFWFSLFHELGHVLLHGNKKNIFLEEIEKVKDNDKFENEANDFASDFLLRKEQFEEIMGKLTSKSRTENEILEIIKSFANNFGTHKDIIIGRILYFNKGLYRYGFLQKELNRMDFNQLLKH
ncbi:HigA family addiction module antidote protein [bacterium]|nr:HigA family addiction module antidote protein [bacterium]